MKPFHSTAIGMECTSTSAACSSAPMSPPKDFQFKSDFHPIHLCLWRLFPAWWCIWGRTWPLMALGGSTVTAMKKLNIQVFLHRRPTLWEQLSVVVTEMTKFCSIVRLCSSQTCRNAVDYRRMVLPQLPMHSCGYSALWRTWITMR